MQLSDFQYELPPELIAQTPPSRRGASRLLELNPDGNTLVDRQFSEIAHLVAPGDLLILNDTRVVPARLLGQKDTGGRVEVLVERVLDTHNCIAHVRANRSPAAGTSFTLAGRARVLVHDRSASLYELKITDDVSWAVLMQDHGEVPLPPYIKRGPDDADRQRYQTVYARHDGAVAAPTAGLHWNEELLRDLEARGVQIEYITLHVGAGTFAPVKVDDISSHPMHAERAVVSERVCDAVTPRARKRRPGCRSGYDLRPRPRKRGATPRGEWRGVWGSEPRACGRGHRYFHLSGV